MANRRPQNNGRRMDFGRNDRGKNFGRNSVSPWQGGGPGGGLPNLLPLAGGSTEATLALASNLINLLQPRQNPVPSLLDMPIRRDFGPNIGRYDRGYVPNRMGNQGNFRRTGNYNRAGERINTNRKPFKPNDGQRQQNKTTPKKDADSKAKPVKESEQDDQNPENGDASVKQEDTKNDIPKTRYDDINAQLLKCHICNKSMWDGRSFENHLSGRAHAIMMQKTAESYALTADTMRQEFKIREMKRTRKIGQQPARDFYCAMCDMYAADGAIHRTTVGHRKLKKYLHPTCTSCHKEMPTRIELDEHRLTAEHLKNIQDKQEIVSKPKPEVMVIATLSMEQSYLRDDRQRRKRYDPQADSPDKETEAAKEGDTQAPEIKKEKDDDDDEVKQEGGDDKKPTEDLDNEKTVLDYNEGDDITGITADMLPAYSTERGVGRSFLSDFRCVQCKLCRKLLDNDETADVHLRTWRHHQLFVRLLTESGQQQTTTTQETGKRPMNSDDSGNWKRRKTTPDADDEHQEDDNEPNDQDDACVKEEPSGDLVDGPGDGEVHNPDDMEDWEQSLDEILEDEKVEDVPEKPVNEPEPEKPKEDTPAPSPVAAPAPAAATPAPVAAPAPVVSPAPCPSPAPAPTPSAVPAAVASEKPKPSPRGRGRGRGRHRY